MHRFLLLGWIFLISVSAFGQALPEYITFPSDVDWVRRKSDHFEVVYRRGEDRLAERTLLAAEKARRLILPIFPEAPDNTFILLADFQDSINGYALNFPYSHFVIFASPPDAVGILTSLDNWLDSVVLHEYVHILHLYPAHGVWGVMRTLFGNWVLPNGLLPSHLHEGIATHLETELTTGGRGRGPHFKMFRRMAVNAGLWGNEFVPLDLLDGSSYRWPQGTSAYFFGQTLYKELWARKGPKGIYDLTLSYSDNWPFFVNGPLKEVYGVDYPTVWSQIFQKTGASTRDEIADIKKHPLSPLTYLTRNKFHKWDVTLSPDQSKVAYRSTNPEDRSAIEVRDRVSGKLIKREVRAIGSAEGFCWGKWGKKDWWVFLQEIPEFQYATNRLVLFDVDSGANRQLLKEDKSEKPMVHLQRLACSPSLQRVLLYREEAGNGEIVEVSLRSKKGEPSELDDENYGLIRKWRLPEGTWISGLLAQEPGSPHWFGLRQGNSTFLYRWSSGIEPAKILEIPAHAYNFRRGITSDEVLAIASLDGREEVWSIDTSRKLFTKRVALLGGTDGFDWASGSDTYVLASYDHGGYDIATAKAVTAAPIKALAPTPSVRGPEPAAVTAIGAPEEYSALKTLYPRAWLPSLLIVPNGLQVGAFIVGFDLTQRHLYNLIGGYDSRGLPFGDASYEYRFAKSMSLDVTAGYDPSYFISSKSFLKQWGGSVGLGFSIGAGWPNLKVSALFRRMEKFSTTPSNQSVGVNISASQAWGLKRRPLDISPISGTKASLSYSKYFKELGSNDNYFSTVGTLEQYLEAPWMQGHVWYLNAKAGYTEGTTRLNSYFQGGGELIFNQYREFFLNRGFLPQSFFGRRIFNLNVEYRFPIVRIERGYKLLPGFLKTIHAAVVGDVTTYDWGIQFGNPNHLFRTFYGSAGLEIKTDWTFAYYFPSQLRLGLYHAFNDYGESFYYTFGFEASI